MIQDLSRKFEISILFGFGRYVANFAAVTGLALTGVGLVKLVDAYPEKRLAMHPLDWYSTEKSDGKLPDDYTAYTYEKRYPANLSTLSCFGKNSVGAVPVTEASKIAGWDASLFGEAMIAFEAGEVKPQTNSTYDEYSSGKFSGVEEGIAQMAQKVCEEALKSSSSTDTKDVFWEARGPVLIASANYGKYFTEFNEKEDERKAELVPGLIILLSGVLIAFLSSMSSSLFAIERNTRERVESHK